MNGHCVKLDSVERPKKEMEFEKQGKEYLNIYIPRSIMIAVLLHEKQPSAISLADLPCILT